MLVEWMAQQVILARFWAVFTSRTVVQFAIRRASRSCSLSRPRFSGFQHLRTSPETKFGGRSSDAVQAYAREGGVPG
jgi:hypothetical protein